MDFSSMEKENSQELKSSAHQISKYVNNFFESQINEQNFCQESQKMEGILQMINKLCQNKVPLQYVQKGTKYCPLCNDYVYMNFHSNQSSILNDCEPINHPYHKDCLQKAFNKIDKFAREENFKNVKCFQKKCTSVFSEKLTQEMIAFRKKKLFDCPICYNTQEIEEKCITLECVHRICSDCLAQDLKDKIKNRKQLICFQDGCERIVNQYIAIENSKKYKYEQELMAYFDRKVSEMQLKPTEIKVLCKGYLRKFRDGSIQPFTHPGTIMRLRLGLPLYEQDKQNMAGGELIECDSFCIRDIRDATNSQYDCLQCQNSFCVYGCDDPHEKFTCQQFEQWKKDNAQGDDIVNDIIQQQGLQPCGNCKIPVQKISGCNQISCPHCKQFFCWKCLKWFQSQKECYDHLNKAHGGHST